MKKRFQPCHWTRLNFCTRNATSFFTFTSRSTPTPPDPRGRTLAVASRLHSSGGRGEPGPSAGEGLLSHDRVSEIFRRPGRLCSLHCHLSDGLEIRSSGGRN